MTVTITRLSPALLIELLLKKRHANRGRINTDFIIRKLARRIGFGLFWIYVACYGGFIALVLFAPGLLSARPFGGVNLAIACGLGLIVAALLLAVVYMVACRIVEGAPRD